MFKQRFHLIANNENLDEAINLGDRGQGCGILNANLFNGSIQRRIRKGPQKGGLVWGEFYPFRALKILHNPRYAGAFFYGRTHTRKKVDGSSVTECVPKEEWNNKLRAVAEAQDLYEKQSQTYRIKMDDQKREQIITLVKDYPRLWNDPGIPPRERKRMIRLLIEDVTLIRYWIIV